MLLNYDEQNKPLLMDLTKGMIMELPIVTALAAGFLAIMQALLMVAVGNRRRASSISVGDGGDEDLLLLMRRHGNFVENAPMVLILMALLEVLGVSQSLVMGFAGLFVVTRISHAISMSSANGPIALRVVGALGTLISLVGGGGLLIWHVSAMT